MSAIATLLMVLSLLAGGSGATVYAAQDVLPTHPLYSFKVLTEDVRLSLAPDAATRAALSLEFATRRAGELAVLARQGDSLPEPVMARQQAQNSSALHAASALQDPAMQQELHQAREMLGEQLQIVTSVQASEQAAQLEPVREMLRTQLALAELGLHDPQSFRKQMGGMTSMPGPHGPMTPQVEREHTPQATGTRPSMTMTPQPIHTRPPMTMTPQPTHTLQMQTPVPHATPTQHIQQQEQQHQQQMQQSPMQQQQQNQDQQQQPTQEQTQEQQQEQTQQQMQEQMQQQMQQQQQQQQQQQASPTCEPGSSTPMPGPGPNGSGGRR